MPLVHASWGVEFALERDLPNQSLLKPLLPDHVANPMENRMSTCQLEPTRTPWTKERQQMTRRAMS